FRGGQDACSQARDGIGRGGRYPRPVQATTHPCLTADQLVLGTQLREEPGHAADRRAVLAADAQVEQVERSMLELQSALELLRFDDRVDAELAGVAPVGVLQGAFASLQQSACPAMYDAQCRGQDQLHGELTTSRGQE